MPVDPLGILKPQSDNSVSNGTDPLGILKKKSGTNTGTTPSDIGSFNTSPIQKPTGTITNQQTLDAQSHISNAPQISTEQQNAAKDNAKVQKAAADKINKAAQNTFNKTIGKGAYTKSDSTNYVDQLKQGVANGDLGITQDAEGNDVIKNSGNFFQSFKAAADQAYAQNIEDKYLRGVSKDEAISYLNRIQQHPETGIVKEQDIAPNGIGKALGEQASMLGKGTIGTLAGAETGLTGGASAGSFMALANDMANAGYSNALKKNYNILKQQGLSDGEAFDKATHAALIGEAVNLGTGALLSGEIKVVPTPSITTEGFVNSLKHTIKSAPKVLGSTAAGSVINDITTNAMSNGNPIDGSKMMKDAEESVTPMAIMHFGLGALTAIANGQKTIVPSAARPQIENIVASADRQQVSDYLHNQEASGAIPEGTTQKVLNKLNDFDEQKQVVNDMPLSEEQKASITGKLLQRKDIVEQTKELKKYGASFTNEVENNEAKIAALDDDVNKIISTKQPFKFERDEAGERLQDAGGRPIQEEIAATPTVDEQARQQAQTVIQPKENVRETIPVKSEVSSNIEQELPDGRSPVTLNGSTEKERQFAIQQRQKETKQTPMTFSRDALLERIDKYNKLDRRQKRGAYNEANSIKLAVDEFNKTHEQQHSIRSDNSGNLELKNNPTDKRPSGRPIKYTLKGGERSIVDNSVPLMERPDNTKKVFQDLLDADALPVARRVGGEIMPEGEHEATIQDIMDGIPSERAENYLNSLEKQIKNDDFDFGEPNKTQKNTLKDVLGIQSENNGEPMTVDNIQKWLNDEAEITPEDQTTLDNIDNLITYYEQQHNFPENAISAKVSEPNGTGKETGSAEVKQNEQPKVENKSNSENLNNNQDAIPKQATNEKVLGNENKKSAEQLGLPEVGRRNSEQEVAAQKEEKTITSSDENPPLKPPLKPPTEYEDVVHAEHPQAVFTHQGLQQGATEFGLDDVTSRDRKTDVQFRKDVETKINEWKDKGEYNKNIDTVLEDAQRGKANELEQGILQQHQANLYNEARKIRQEKGINSPEYQKVYDELNKFTKIGQEVRSEAGATLRQKSFGSIPDESLEGMLLKTQDDNKGAELTEKQKTDVQEQWEKLNEAKLEFEKYKEQILAESAKASAEKEFEKKKTTTKKVAKKSHEDYVKERKDAVAAAREALKKLRTGESGLSAVPLPGVRELIAIAPHVTKALGSLLEEGAIKLVDAVKILHEEFKDVIDGLTEKNIHDIISGEYNEKKGTRNEAVARKRDLQTEAALINRLEKLQKGEVPTNEKAKQQRNQEIAELIKKIGEQDVTKLETIRKRNEATLEKLNQKLASNDFEPEPKKSNVLLDDELAKRNPELYKKAQESRDNLIKLRKDIEVARLKQQVALQPKILTVANQIANVANVPRAAMSTADLSAPLRQGLWGVTSQLMRLPIGENEGFKSQKLLANQFKYMFKAAGSQKFFDRWFFDIQESPRFHLAEETKLAITDPHDPVLSAHEEAYMTNLVEKIPLVGGQTEYKIGGKSIRIPTTGIVKGSERAYVMFLNKMRWDMFNSMIDSFEKDGKTYQNSPELYKATAKYVNAATGRGDLGKVLNSAAPILNASMFSPRLIASRVGLITHTLTYALPSVDKAASLFKSGEKPLLPYNGVPKEIRVQHYKDLARFIGLGATILGAASLYSHVTKDKDISVETDPRSSDFGKIRNGHTRYDIWGGFQQYIRLAAEMFSGQSKSSNTGQIQELNGQGLFGKTKADVLGSFVRGKTSPTVSMFWDYAAGRTIDGQPFALNKELVDHAFPLLYSDVKDAYKDKGVSGLFETLPLSTFGVGVQTFLPKGYDNVDLNDKVYKSLYKNDININEPEQSTITHEDKSPVTEREYKVFLQKRQKYFYDAVKDVIDNGVYINDEGAPTSDESKAKFNEQGEDVRKPFDKLTQVEKISIIKILSGNATRYTKKDMFEPVNQ